MRSDGGARVPPAVVWLYLALGLLLLVVVRHAWLCDDAYVTFRTVRNWGLQTRRLTGEFPTKSNPRPSSVVSIAQI